jgi:putative nucleotidyltransferase with HDIG domain
MTTHPAPHVVIDELIAGVRMLASLPTVVTRVISVLDDPRATSQQIVEVVQQDAAFAAHILRVANSAFFGAAQRIDSLSKAIIFLGTTQIRNLAFGLAVAQSFQGIPNTLLSMRTFWNHSILCAICARLLAMEAPAARAEAAFVGGLLHDIGKLVLATGAPDAARLALVESTADPLRRPLYLCERDVFGFDHAEVGGALAKRWLLPANLVAAVEFHHDPEHAATRSYEAAVVHIANSLAHLAELKSLDPRDAPPIAAFAWQRTGLTEAAIPRVVPAARAAAAEVRHLFNLVLTR